MEPDNNYVELFEVSEEPGGEKSASCGADVCPGIAELLEGVASQTKHQSADDRKLDPVYTGGNFKGFDELWWNSFNPPCWLDGMYSSFGEA